MSKYRRIKYEDRCQIYALSKRGSSQESIAEVLGVSQSAVSREIHRNRGERGYRFKQAEAKAQARQAIRSRPRKLTAPLRRKIEAKLRQMRWSPEQISGWLSEQGIKLSHERIYQMIWDDKRDGGNLWRSLRRRGKRYNKRAGKNAGRGLIPNRIDISEPRTSQIASAGPHEHRRHARQRAFALNGIEDLGDFHLHHLCRAGSGSPSSANPLARSRHESHAPHGRPASSGS